MYVYIDDPTCDIRPSWGGHCRNCAANTCAVLGGQRPEPEVSCSMQRLCALNSAFDMLPMFTCTLQILAEV